MTPKIERTSHRSVPDLLDAMGLAADIRDGVTALSDRIYGHVLRVIDLDRLYQLEQCVWSELDRLRIDDEDGDLATSLLAAALHRVGCAPERQCKTVPDGITEEEEIAAGFDEACLMCQHEVADLEYRMSGRRCEHLTQLPADKEWRALQARAAKAWRAEHADALRRFDVMMARRGPAS
jgi:hypothetical protein